MKACENYTHKFFLKYYILQQLEERRLREPINCYQRCFKCASIQLPILYYCIFMLFLILVQNIPINEIDGSCGGSRSVKETMQIYIYKLDGTKRSSQSNTPTNLQLYNSNQYIYIYIYIYMYACSVFQMIADVSDIDGPLVDLELQMGKNV